jgi:cytochrome c553
MLQRRTSLARTSTLARGGPLRKKSKGKAAADRVQHAAYAAADDAEQEWCSVCGKAGPVEHSHLYSQHLHEQHKNNPLNWLQSCRRCHEEYENKRPLFAKKWPKAWALIIERMRAIDLKAYDFYAATIPELYPD